MLDLLEKWLSKLKYRHLRYDGSLSVGVKRQAIIDKVAYMFFFPFPCIHFLFQIPRK